MAASTRKPKALSVVMLGATGAVGNHVALTLAGLPDRQRLRRLTLLGRRPAANVRGVSVAQVPIDIFDQATYEPALAGHDVAVCTLGVGQPSQMSRAEFLKIDRDAVLAFAAACQRQGVRHFELLSSVGAQAASPSFYLRTKGQLEDRLKALGFERLSLFQPSMILTPTNRYGLLQAITLAVTPVINPVLCGPARKFRGIAVETLGRAMALNVVKPGEGLETLQWAEFMGLVGS